MITTILAIRYDPLLPASSGSVRCLNVATSPLAHHLHRQRRTSNRRLAESKRQLWDLPADTLPSTWPTSHRTCKDRVSGVLDCAVLLSSLAVLGLCRFLRATRMQTSEVKILSRQPSGSGDHHSWSSRKPASTVDFEKNLVQTRLTLAYMKRGNEALAFALPTYRNG